MKRKVVKHGPSTFIISLPAKWVKRNHVRKGDSLHVQQRADSLLVSINTADTSRRMERDVSRMEAALVEELVRHGYRHGYDEMVLTGNSVEHMERIRDLLPQLLGFVMIRQDPAECRIVSLSKEIDLTFEGALDNALATTVEMLTRLREFRSADTDWLNALRLREQDVQKLCNFCHRQLSKGSVSADLRTDYSLMIEEIQSLVSMVPELGEQLIEAGRPGTLVESVVLLARQFQCVQTFMRSSQREDAERILQLGRQISDEIQQGEGRTAMDVALVEHLVRRMSESITHLSVAHLFVAEERQEEDEGERAAEAAA